MPAELSARARSTYASQDRLERTRHSDHEPRTTALETCATHAVPSLFSSMRTQCANSYPLQHAQHSLAHCLRWGLHDENGDLAPQRSLGSLHVGGPARFIAYDLSLQLVIAVRLAAASWRTVGDLADQGRRAAISISLNLREGSAYPAGSPTRRRFFDIAHASAFEVEAVLDIARCCGFDAVDERAAQALAGRVAAMTTVLVRGR